VWLDDEEVPVRASIETIGGLSAHADRRELLRWLRGIPDEIGVRRRTAATTALHGQPV
jgi:metallo-beta-lactamase family protein